VLTTQPAGQDIQSISASWPRMGLCHSSRVHRMIQDSHLLQCVTVKNIFSLRENIFIFIYFFIFYNLKKLTPSPQRTVCTLVKMMDGPLQYHHNITCFYEELGIPLE
jgi:hypothetical protein